MATFAASTSLQEQCQKVRQRLETVRTRPTTIAAEEFFADNDWRTLPHRLERLVHVLQAWNAPNGSPELSCSFAQDPQESRRIALTASIMASAPPTFLTSFQSLFRASLNNDVEQTNLAQNLQILGWIRLNGMLQRPLAEAIHGTILQKVQTTIAGDFESNHLNELHEWKHTTVEPWLKNLVGMTDFEQNKWSDRLTLCTAECYCLCRMEEIFDMVADYPDSHTAVVELRNVLDDTKMHAQLGTVLRASLIRRLNHPGANTSQIIDVYIATIKVLRVIDPSDRLLGVVAEPVRNYLRGRNDTVRCIISSLTDAEVGGDLYEELRRQDAKPLENITVDSDDEEEPPDMSWQPPPSINKPKGTFLEGSSRGGDGDILAMLVSIYGSKELFVNEYRLMLAGKLLQNLDYNTDKEVHTLELLKLRFGEMSMRNCEVMIKDMEDSKRANGNIHSTLDPDGSDRPVVDAAMISHIFWPSLQSEQLKHHPRIQNKLDVFSGAYAKLKNPRKLIWLNQLGTVQLELDVVEDGPAGKPVVERKEFTCSPLLATLISHFEDKTEWTAEDLSNETGVPEHIIQKRMTYWVNNRVIKVVSSSGSTTYEIASLEHYTQGEHSTSMMDVDGEDHAVSVTTQEEEEMDVYVSYIVGMLTNLGQLSLKTIHNNLKTFVTGSDIRYDKTPQQLSAFLQHLCKQEKLECGPDGMYKLFKK